MRFLTRTFTPTFFIGTVLAMSALSSARNTSSHDCVSFTEASKHVGTSACVSGTVLAVEDGRKGAKILNFCKDPKACPFTVVVFPGDLKKMGDVRQLEGRQIEIKGTIQDYDGRAEIILRRSQQLGEGAFLLFPTVPTDYDVERAGHYSAGKFKRSKTAKKKDPKQDDPMSIEDPDEP
jgi:DNA/RNA endonuclease YhcR with UshA esterase domain